MSSNATEATTAKRIKSAAVIRVLATEFLLDNGFTGDEKLGLPEIDDRFDVWRVAVMGTDGSRCGEIAFGREGDLCQERTSNVIALKTRLFEASRQWASSDENKDAKPLKSPLLSMLMPGDCNLSLATLPPCSVDLLFTSPPYYNARVEYSEYSDYAGYIAEMRKVIRASHRVLGAGRFFVLNTSPVLVRRASRSQASQRLAVPFDLHAIMIAEGFDFVDDIIWQKPEGAGWATGRGRRFAADRNPLQYKAVPVTEYVLVYRKRTSRLIDWNIRSHPDPSAVADSKIEDGYEKTNIWRIAPASNSKHPAAFPQRLAENVVRYYSFKGEVVLDPFAGSGTTGVAAHKLGRKFVLCEVMDEYLDLTRTSLKAAGADFLEAAPHTPKQEGTLVVPQEKEEVTTDA